MKNMKKKIIAIVVMLGVLGTIITGNIHATVGNTFVADVMVGGKAVGVEFKITEDAIDGNNGKVMLTNENNLYNPTPFVGDLIIPKTVQDDQGNIYDVTKIAESAFSGCGELKTVVISEQITCIEIYAFTQCSKLETVIFLGDIPEMQYLQIGLTVYAFDDSTHFYYLEGAGNTSNFDSANSSPIKAPYTLDVNITDVYDKYHVDDIYTGEDIVVTKKYMSGGAEIYKTQTSKEDEGIVLPEGQKLVAGENTIEVSYNATKVSFKVNASDHEIGEWETKNEPTTTAEGLKVRKCKICGEVLESESIAKLPIIYTYKVLEGEESYTKGTKKDIIYKIDGDYRLFTGIKMDGNDVDKDNYTSKQGSTIITFKSAYLESLSEGNHEMTVIFHGNDVKISLAVQPDPNQTDDKTSETKPDIPADIVPNTPVLNDNASTTNQTNDSPAKNENVVSTSDETSMLAYMGIFVLSGMIGSLAFKKRKEI